MPTANEMDWSRYARNRRAVVTWRPPRIVGPFVLQPLLPEWHGCARDQSINLTEGKMLAQCLSLASSSAVRQYVAEQWPVLRREELGPEYKELESKRVVWKDEIPGIRFDQQKCHCLKHWPGRRSRAPRRVATIACAAGNQLVVEPTLRFEPLDHIGTVGGFLAEWI